MGRPKGSKNKSTLAKQEEPVKVTKNKIEVKTVVRPETDSSVSGPHYVAADMTALGYNKHWIKRLSSGLLGLIPQEHYWSFAEEAKKSTMSLDDYIIKKILNLLKLNESQIKNLQKEILEHRNKVPQLYHKIRR